ncbi:hypothetical protein [Treponema sp.]|uniref:hypothetical protein n=1 Tax=Treponema sp. TaxID=166 RepID=UPI0025E7CF85|nr:hypothetical protein [Treponema sp.]MCR5218598.1 hypothetical protein [Treponema sp.]
MAFSTAGFQPQHETYLEVGKEYRTRIRSAEIKQSVDNGQIVDQLVISLDVSGVKSPVPNSLRFKSRPTQPGKSQDAWDRRWTRFKEIFGIEMNNEQFASWSGKIGELIVSEFRGAAFFDFPRVYAQPLPPVVKELAATVGPAPEASDGTFNEDIPF